MKIKRYSFLLIIITSSLLAQNVNELIKLGNNEVNITFNYSKGLEYYNQALKLDPENIILLNKISKATVFVGDNLPRALANMETELKFGKGLNDEKESLDSSEISGAQIENYQIAFELANKVLAIEPNNVEAYVRRAIANARIAVTKGIFKVAKLVNQIKADLELAIKIGTGGKDVLALAHYVLAKTHDELSNKWRPARAMIGLGWGNIEIALKEYKIAIKLKPDVRAFYLDYAKALIKEDFEDIAKQMLEKVKTCPVLDSEDDKRLEEANELLSSL